MDGMNITITKADALKLFDGNSSRLARAIDVDPSTVSKWRDGPLPFVYSAAVLLAAGRLQPKRKKP